MIIHVTTDNYGDTYTCSMSNDSLWGTAEECHCGLHSSAGLEVSNSTGKNALHGTNYTLMCTLSRIRGMNLMPSLEWVGPDCQWG